MANIFQAIGGALGSVNPLIGAGLLSGIGSLGASLFGSQMGVKQSKELMDYQYQLQQKAIDAQNLYNSPAEQMKRLVAAQLNPNLVYGHGVDGNQSSAANVSAVNRNVDLSNPLQDLAQNVQNSEMLELAKQKQGNENTMTRVNSIYTAARTLGEMLNNKFLSSTIKTRIARQEQELANEAMQENKMQSDINLNASRANQIEVQNELTRENITLTQLKQATERCKPNLLRAQAYDAWKRGELTDKQIKWFDSLSNAKLKLIREQTYYYTEAASNQDTQGWLNEEKRRGSENYNDFMEDVYLNSGGITPAQLLKLIIAAGK